jgi:methionyl-tRNA formyltransferase
MPNDEDNGVDLNQPSFKKFAHQNNYTILNLSDIVKIKDLIFISLECSRLLSIDKFISKQLFNVHFSLLPKYRGMYTSAHPLLNGEITSGVTLHLIDNGIDSGPIIDQLSFNIEDDLSSEGLYDKYLKYGELIFQRNIKSLIRNTFSVKPQDHALSTYYSKKSINYKELRINFNTPAREVKNQFRAYSFRNFQLPRYGNFDIYGVVITSKKCYGIPGSMINEDEDSISVNTLDFEVRLLKDFYSKFWDAIKEGNFQEAKSIQLKIPCIDKLSPEGMSALMYAVRAEHKDIIAHLVYSCANPFAQNLSGISPYGIALSKGHDGVFELAGCIIKALTDTGLLKLYDQTLRHLISHPRYKNLAHLMSDAT